MVKALVYAALAALLLGILSTFGDFIWANWQVRHRMGYGLIHGAAICLAIGAVIGVRAGRPAAGALAGPIVGVLAAGCFYLLAPMMGWSAMFPAWMLFWVCCGLLQARLSGPRAYGPALVRAIIAAGLSGLAFYLVVPGMWIRPPRGGPNYPLFLLAWTFAFFPGFAALFWPGGQAETPTAG